MVVLDSAPTGGASSHLARWLLDRQVAAIGDETEAALEAIPATEGAGYRAGKVSDVAARVGITEPVVFQNFGSKAALFAAVLDRAAHGIRAELQALAGRYGSASELLAHALSPSHAHRLHSAGFHGVLFADAATLTSAPELTGPARQAIRAVAGHLADLIRRGQADGDISGDVDPEAAAWLLSVVSARRLRAVAMPDPDRLEGPVAALAFAALQPAGIPSRHLPGRAASGSDILRRAQSSSPAVRPPPGAGSEPAPRDIVVCSARATGTHRDLVRACVRNVCETRECSGRNVSYRI